jgi:hypothetical protein
LRKTDAGERRKALKREAHRLKWDGKLIEKAACTRPGLLADAAALPAMVENALKDAQNLNDSARLEDLIVR